MNNKIDITRIEEAYQKAKKHHEILNNVITFIDYKNNLPTCEEGKLFNRPIALKDNISTRGIRTTAASHILDNYVPVYDATIVEKLKKEGAVSIAKVSMDELGMGGTNLNSSIGPCYNPWDTRRISGGSSGGSASIVASGAVSIAIGSDTGDSVRKPAAFCGVVGVKPTYGRISRYGVVPYASSLDHVGYFTSNVKDAALVCEVLSGRDDKDMTSSYKEVKEYSKLLNSNIEGKKIAVFKNVIDLIDNEDTLKAFKTLIEKLKEKKAIVEEYSFDTDLLRSILPTYSIIANCEAVANHSNLDGIRFGVNHGGKDVFEIMKNNRTKGFASNTRKRFVLGSYGLSSDNQERLFKKAKKVRRLLVAAYKKCLDDYDCIIAPASSDIAPFIDSDFGYHLEDKYLIAENHMILANFSGYPSMTLPLGFSKECPLGVNITSRAFEEETMFNIGLAIEESTGLKDLVAEVK